MTARRSIGVFVLAAGVSGWNCGNVGPVVGSLSSEFNVGLSLLFIPAYARAIGGVRLLGLFGAGLTLGMAAALWIDGLLEGGDVDWRVSVVIAAALAVAALPLLPNEVVHIKRAPVSEGEGLLGEALSNQAWWRVETLGITTLAIPLVIGAWLVHFLITKVDLAAGVAGALSFMLFGIAALMRDVAGRLAGSGISPHPSRDAISALLRPGGAGPARPAGGRPRPAPGRHQQLSDPGSTAVRERAGKWQRRPRLPGPGAFTVITALVNARPAVARVSRPSAGPG
ncbi:MAG TPA: hypothetical protein VGJ61_04450 [Solirubrobacterales bacterium]